VTALGLHPPELRGGDVVLRTPDRWVNGAVLWTARDGVMWRVETDAGTVALAPAARCEVLRPAAAPVRLPPDTPTAFLAVSRRTLTALYRHGLATVGRLAGATDQELEGVRGVGPAALREVRGALAAAGYPRGGAR
jgi:hypothetical protein